MSLPMEIEAKCYVCKSISKQTILASTNTFGAPDLDLRPAEMARSTMDWWIQECPFCGYVAESIKEKTDIKAKFLKEESYRCCDNRGFKSGLAEQFYKYYLINIACEKFDAAFYAALHAAWACDDSDDKENAIYCRQKALMVIEKTHFNSKNEDITVVKADLLRRTGQFDLLINEYENKKFSKPILNDIIAFEIEKAMSKDDECYNVSDAVSDKD